MVGIAGVYRIRLGGRDYVGQSGDVLSRWRQHSRALDQGVHECRELQEAWNLAGGGTSACFEVLARSEDQHERIALEFAAIKGALNGFNIIGAVRLRDGEASILRFQIADAQRQMIDARAERDRLIRLRVAEGITMYRVAKEMREDLGDDALSQSMVREIVSRT